MLKADKKWRKNKTDFFVGRINLLFEGKRLGTKRELLFNKTKHEDKVVKGKSVE
jgi:hypothetical protein